MYSALARIWETPADVNGTVTDQLLHARHEVQRLLAGAKVGEAWTRWNDHALDVIRRAVRENPGKRLLVLAGVENAATLRPALAREQNVTLVDVEAWLSAKR